MLCRSAKLLAICDCHSEEHADSYNQRHPRERRFVDGRIDGFIIYADSLWDSRIIGRRIGTVKHFAVTKDDPEGAEILRKLTSELTQALTKRRTECVVCRVQSSELAAIHALEQSGFLLMDTLLDFVFLGL